MEERSYVEAKLKPPKEIWAVKRCNEGITIKKCWILSHLLQHARLIPRQRPGLLTLDTPIRSLKSAKQMLIVFTVSKLKHGEDQAFAVVNHDHIPTFLKPVCSLCFKPGSLLIAFTCLFVFYFKIDDFTWVDPTFQMYFPFNMKTVSLYLHTEIFSFIIKAFEHWI